VLVDKQGPEQIQTIVRKCIEDDDTRIADLHLWSIGPKIYAVIVSVVADDPQPPAHYKELIPSSLGLVHVTVEVHPCSAENLVSKTSTYGT
jgi:Co/Zn/Cd efflux system component